MPEHQERNCCRPARRHVVTLLALCLAFCTWATQTLAAAEPPQKDGEAPRVQALLEQGWAAESGRGLQRSPALAATLYQEAGQLGSGEGYYRAALIYWHGPSYPLTSAAFCRLAIASQLGHERASALLERQSEQLRNSPANPAANCAGMPETPEQIRRFDLEGYVSGLAAGKQQVAGLIRRLAPRYQVDTRLALAVAAVESNFDQRALSPKNAMGVMQLIPATAERFAVRDPYDPEQNVRGGLAYLRWLHGYYGGDPVRAVAAYNAGEKAVDRYGGIPPYAETLAYVARVLAFAGQPSTSHTKHRLQLNRQ